MTLNEALIASLNETIATHIMWHDHCLWVAQKDAKTVWIHTETKNGYLASYTIPLSVLKHNLCLEE